MKYLSRLLAGALLVSLTACSSDEPTAPGGETTEPGEPFYSTISFKMPTGSRSGEANEGEEVGKDYENYVGSILVILSSYDETANDYKFITCAANDATGSNDKYTIVFQNRDELLAHAGEEVYVFAYCNPTQALRNTVLGNPVADGYVGGLAAGTSFKDLVCGGEDDDTDVTSTWMEKGFLMTSVSLHKVFLGDEKEKGSGMPTDEEAKKIYKATHEAYLKTFSVKTNAFPLCPNIGTADKPIETPIEVVRTASRFDIRDASPKADGKDFTYYVYKDGVDWENKDYVHNDEDVVASVSYTRVALFNVSNQFYYLPRTSLDGTMNSAKYCPGTIGMEYIADPNNGDKLTSAFVVSPTSRTYSMTLAENAKLDPTADNPGGLTWTSLESIKDKDDNDNSWNQKEGESTSKKPEWEGYKIWTYASENTFPKNATADPYETKTNTTGIVFEAEINVTTEKGENGKYPTMYLFKSQLYKSDIQMAIAAKQNPSSELAQRFDQCFTAEEDETGKIISVTTKALEENKTIDNYGFTAYEPTADGKYRCYYFYYNQHINDNDPAAIGNMEFATVRNNIYKLSIKTVRSLGNFTQPDPGAWDIYFTLDVVLKDWVVRVNEGIEF